MKDKKREMIMKRKFLGLAALLMVLVLVLSSCGAKDAAAAKKDASPTAAVMAVTTDAPETEAETPEPGPIIEPQAIADYIFEHGELPENFITKKEAKELGWDSSYNYVSDVAPGMSIGGDYFGNYEGNLPRVKGRKYYECDCYYTGGERNDYRIIYSNDGHVWYTEDHYNTFTEMEPSH